MAAALEPAATAFATDGICALTSPAAERPGTLAVSYTHLTLPTIYSV